MGAGGHLWEAAVTKENREPWDGGPGEGGP